MAKNTYAKLNPASDNEFLSRSRFTNAVKSITPITVVSTEIEILVELILTASSQRFPAPHPSQEVIPILIGVAQFGH